VNGHQDPLNGVILPVFDRGAPDHALQNGLGLSGADERFASPDQAFVRVKPHEDGAVVCLKSSLKTVAFRPGLAYALRHGNAGGEDFVLAETHPAGG